MNELYENLAASLRRGESAELVVIVESSGSTPRGSGAVMLCFENSPSQGTIGGGNLEYQAQRIAAQALREKKSFLQLFRLHPNEIADLGMVCGGDTLVMFHHFDAHDPEILALWDQVDAVGKNQVRAWIVTEISEDSTFRTAVCRSLSEISAQFSGLSGDDMRELGREKSVFYRKGSKQYYSEPLTPPACVYLFGGGHISYWLAPLLDTVGFRTVVYDDRPEFANKDRFPTASRVVIADFDAVEENLNIMPHDYIVIMTNGHKHDYSVLAQTLRLHPFYIGMIGSRQKIGVTYQKMMQIDGYTNDELQKVHAPIGLGIGSETPEEIAVSITAQLIQIRAGKRE